MQTVRAGKIIRGLVSPGTLQHEGDVHELKIKLDPGLQLSASVAGFFPTICILPTTPYSCLPIFFKEMFYLFLQSGLLIHRFPSLNKLLSVESQKEVKGCVFRSKNPC